MFWCHPCHQVIVFENLLILCSTSLFQTVSKTLPRSLIRCLKLKYIRGKQLIFLVSWFRNLLWHQKLCETWKCWWYTRLVKKWYLLLLATCFVSLAFLFPVIKLLLKLFYGISSFSQNNSLFLSTFPLWLFFTFNITFLLNKRLQDFSQFWREF